MTPPESIARATQWLQDLVNELSGLRNATSRDPSFKNWRQNALTILQRIWPSEQEHAERFRRIPFSPVDPRADMRAQRESFSRGCQEAARVLTSFIEEVLAKGVPETADIAPQTEESGFEDGFPTVDLPSGELGSTLGGAADPYDDLPELQAQGTGAGFEAPPGLRVDVPANAPPSSAHPASVPPESRPARKGLGVAAKLRDLLGLTGFAAKPATPTPGTGGSGSFQSPPLQRSLDIVPVGDEVTDAPRSRSWPAQRATPPANPAPPAPENSEPPAPPPTSAPAEPGMSVVMSRPTTLRSSIEKVSIESLISPEFRAAGENAGTATPPAPGNAPPASETPENEKPTANRPSGPTRRGTRTPGSTPVNRTGTPAERPPLSIVPPLSGDPEFNVDPAPDTGATATPVPPRSSNPSKVVPLPVRPGARVPDPTAETSPVDENETEPASEQDREELARATEDFMRSSPVLGATGRKVQRPGSEGVEAGFSDPDAIAVFSMVDELTLLGIPTTRQSETRARLLDLARRIEAADLEWNTLRKAVWFAMEYPEVARRLMPLLLPWIDRAA